MIGLRHRRKRPASQPHPPSDEPQENNNESPSNNIDNGTTTKKRKGRTRTQLKNPPNGVRIAIKPEGDDHFTGDKGIGGQITALLKREYPSVIKERNKEGLEIKRHASSWDDYYINKITEGENIGQAATHCFMLQFWSIYKLADDGPAQRIEADNVLENAARRQFRQMWYQARKESVKLYYRAILQQPMKDHDACTKQLAKSEYMQAQLYWCTDDEVWESICDYWCSSEYKGLRQIGQQSRFKSKSIAQNKGGSRSFVQTKIVLGEEYGPAAATNMNTYKCMKAGVTNCTETGESGPMNNVKAQGRVDDYIKAAKVAHPENWEEHDLDPEIVYSSGGGMPHGRLAMGNGVIKKAVVFAKAREKDIRPSNSMSYQDLSRNNVQLERRCKNDFILSKHLQIVYGKMGWEIPEDLLAFHDELVDDSTGDPMDSILEAQEDGGASLTDPVRAEDDAHATHLNEHGDSSRPHTFIPDKLSLHGYVALIHEGTLVAVRSRECFLTAIHDGRPSGCEV